MYAVIEAGGKQYRVELGSEIQVDRLDVRPGDSITLDRVLLVADDDATAIGRPVVDGATVSAEVLGQDRGAKIVVFKYKPKARTRVKQGFRAELTTLRISDIALGGKSAAEDAKAEESAKAKEAEKTRKAERSAAEKAAAEKAAADKELAAKMAAKQEEAASAEPKAKASGTRKKTSAKTTAKAEKAEPASEDAMDVAADAEDAKDADGTKKDE